MSRVERRRNKASMMMLKIRIKVDATTSNRSGQGLDANACTLVALPAFVSRHVSLIKTKHNVKLRFSKFLWGTAADCGG
jgi:hypothetical protein